MHVDTQSIHTLWKILKVFMPQKQRASEAEEDVEISQTTYRNNL